MLSDLILISRTLSLMMELAIKEGNTSIINQMASSHREPFPRVGASHLLATRACQDDLAERNTSINQVVSYEHLSHGWELPVLAPQLAKST